MNESQDNKPHVITHGDGVSTKARGESLSIWFFCGVLTLVYGFVLVVQALFEHFHLFHQHPPTTILANLHPTFWWGACLFLFGAFYTVRFRPGKQ